MKPTQPHNHSLTCWICNAPADSSEHRIKRSILGTVLGVTAPANRPVHLSNEKGHRRIKSWKANVLKFSKSICRYCNSTRTQNHDRALDRLITFVQTEHRPIGPGACIDLSSVFPDSLALRMIDVQLYFAKLMGCLIAEHRIPIDLHSFGSSILHNSPHPHLYLTFGVLPGTFPTIAQSDFKIIEHCGQIHCSSFIQTLGKLSVMVFYSPFDNKYQGVENAWRPNQSSSAITLRNLETMNI